MRIHILSSVILAFVTLGSQNIFCQKTSESQPAFLEQDFSSKDLELAEGIQLISSYKKIANENQVFTPRAFEKVFLLKFFQHLWGNKKVNKKLRSIKYQKSRNQLSNADPQIISYLIEYTYKTQKNYDDISFKINILLEKLKKHQNIELEEQLKIRELRQLVSMEHLQEIFDHFEGWGLLKILSADPRVASLKENVKSASELHKMLLDNAYESQPKRGVLLLAYDFRNDFAYRKANASYLLTLEALAYILNLRVSHFSITFNWNDTKYESHMWGKPSKYNIAPMPLVSYVYDTYRLKIEKLIPVPSVMINQFRELYGDHWYQAIEYRLDDIMKKYFIEDQNENFARLYNPELRRFKSVFALDYSLTKTRLEDQIYFSHSGKVTCSEFIAKALLQCIELLNQKIAMDWQEHGSTNKKPAPYLKFPIKRARKIKRYSPQEYFDHLIEYELIEQIKTPPLLAKAVKIK